jgi:hypothetical protein
MRKYSQYQTYASFSSTTFVHKNLLAAFSEAQAERQTDFHAVRSSPFWDVTRRRFVVTYRRFGTTVEWGNAAHPTTMSFYSWIHVHPLWKHPILHWWHHFNQKIETGVKRNIFYFLFQATFVKESVWKSRWMEASLRQQRTLMFMMTAANQDLALTAGGFAPLSRHTMMTVRHSGTETLNSIRNTKCGMERSGPSNVVQPVPLCDFHFESAQFESGAGHQHPWQRLLKFLQSLQANTVKTPVVKQRPLP